MTGRLLRQAEQLTGFIHHFARHEDRSKEFLPPAVWHFWSPLVRSGIKEVSVCCCKRRWIQIHSNTWTYSCWSQRWIKSNTSCCSSVFGKSTCVIKIKIHLGKTINFVFLTLKRPTSPVNNWIHKTVCVKYEFNQITGEK